MNKEFKLENEHFHSYLCLSMVSLIADIFIFLIIWSLYFILSDNEMCQYTSLDIIVFVTLTLVYLIFTLLVNHKVILLLIIDKLKKDVVEENIIPIEFELKKPWKSYQFMNNISIFYPKELNVNKYNLVCLKNDKKFKIRLIMSQKKQIYTNNNILKNPKINEIKIKYYKRSKILISVALSKNANYKIEEEKCIHKFNKTL